MPFYFDRGVDLYPAEEAARPVATLPTYQRCNGKAAQADEYASWALPTAGSFEGVQLPWFFLRFRFTLATAYASKDDGTEEERRGNPIVKEWVFRSPMIRPTTWKGCLRFAAREIEGPEGEAEIERLFGTEEPQKQGRLHFFPTIFDCDEGKQVLAPHDRVKRRGRLNVSPVTLHVVPAKKKGDFAILYAGEPGETKEDLKRVARQLSRWLPPLLTQIGIGAKTLKGDGLCRAEIEAFQAWPKLATVEAPKTLWELKAFYGG